MILSDIRRYIRARGRASLDELVARFDMDKSAIEGMMETLKARGLVTEAGCGSCSSSGGCSFQGPRIYVAVPRGQASGGVRGTDLCRSSG